MTFVSDAVNSDTYAGLPEKRAQPRLIICEGHSDHGVLLALSRTFDLNGAQLHVARGRGNFSRPLRAARVQGYEAVLLVSDNDDDPTKSWKEVCAQIRDAGYNAPIKPRDIVTDKNGGPPLTVLMIPWDEESCAIEKLCLPALEHLFAAQMNCVNDFCTCTSVNDWGATASSIARVEFLLACTQESTPKIGLGHFVIKSKCPLDFRHDCFSRVADALRTFSTS